MAAVAEIRRYPPVDRDAHPPLLFPPYTASIERAPHEPLVPVDPTPTEIAPVRAPRHWPVGADDLTVGRADRPIGERIIVTGQVRAGDVPQPGALVEIWQANAAGRYVHEADVRDAPVDPGFLGAGRCVTDDDGWYRFVTVRPGAYPGRSHHNAWRPPHIHFSVIGAALVTRLVTQMYFPGDPLLDHDPIYLAVSAVARLRLVAELALDLGEPDVSLAYRFDVVLRGEVATPGEVV